MNTGTRGSSCAPTTGYDADEHETPKLRDPPDSSGDISTTIHSSPRAATETNHSAPSPTDIPDTSLHSLSDQRSQIEDNDAYIKSLTSQSGFNTPMRQPSMDNVKTVAASKVFNRRVETSGSLSDRNGYGTADNFGNQLQPSTTITLEKITCEPIKTGSSPGAILPGNVLSHPNLNSDLSKDKICLKWLVDLLNEFGNQELSEMFHHFDQATIKPPITRQSLAELDIKPIANNAKLRQDINFDRELHFRPNNEGPRGKMKRDFHESYWFAIAAEIELYKIMARGDPAVLSRERPWNMSFATMVKTSQRRLPLMFKTIKDILENLVPPRDVTRVQDGLDADLIMQQVNMQMFDFTDKAKWLSALLKTHCAPMRDRMIDNMLDMIRKEDSRNIAQGLCELFSVLEAMKLDIANHQIRHLRALLIEDTTSFGRKYHAKRIKNKRLQTDESVKWFKGARQRLLLDEANPEMIPRSNPKDDFEVFVTAFIDLVLPSAQQQLPETFALDADRVRDIRNEILEEIHVALCYKVFEDCYVEGVQQDCLIPLRAQNKLKETLRLVISDRQIHLAIPYIALCITSQIQELTGVDALVLNSVLIEEAEQLLSHRLRMGFREFEDQQLEIQQQLFKQVLSIGRKFMTVSAWDLFNALVPSTPPPLPLISSTLPPPPPHQEPHTWPNHPGFPRKQPYSDLAHKIAHIAILHFRLWGPLLYCDADETEPEECELVTPTS
jgi:hypothetical protein